MHNNLTPWNFPSLLVITSKIPYVCHIPQTYAPRLKASGKKIACTAELLYMRKTVLWAAELMRLGFLWVVSNGQIPWCLKRCKLLFSHIEVLTLQYRFAFNISLPKGLGEWEGGGKHNNRVSFLYPVADFQATNRTAICMSLLVEFGQKKVTSW